MSVPREVLSALSLFRDASAAAVSALAKRAIEVRYPAESVIFLAGSVPRGWYVVLEGRVRVVRGSGARQHVVHTELPGGTLGEVPLFAGDTHPATGIAAEPTRCALFAKASLESAMAECPEIGILISKRLALRVRRLVDRLDERSRSVRSRLAEFLLDRLAASKAGNRLSVGLTQQALAEELATVREVVSREIRALVNQKIIEPLGGGRYRVIDVDALRLRAAEER
ncbi:MAG TPA: Crp/Fnr family transcriptional regulator [Gemmatimonadaceae bacterium]|nr:Crp/Fnr family transcriptional regulator [Gemmatimonadaceae bacterium]